MRRFSLGILAASCLGSLPAGRLTAQETALGSVLAEAQSLVNRPLREARRVSGDSLVVVFDDSTLTSDRLMQARWKFGPDGSPNDTAPFRTPKQAGRDVARVLWRGWARDAGVRHLVVEVRGQDNARVRMFYRASDLETPNTQASADAQVRVVVERYLHGLKNNDTTALARAFWPDAKLLFIQRDGTLGQLTQAAWYKTFAGSIGKVEEGDLRIISVDITSNAASVKVVETYPKSVYTDYLNLLRIGTEWRIVNKIYTSAPR